MAKKRRTPAAEIVEPTAEQLASTGLREPCPCGSGKRFKQCHGRERAAAADTYVNRPFEGLPYECDLIALREFVPAGTMEVTVAGTDKPVRLVSLLPTVAPALVREDGSILVAMQQTYSTGDPSRDLAHALSTALETEPGTFVGGLDLLSDGPRLQELITDAKPVEVHEGFDFWIPEDTEDENGEIAATLERANAAADPTVRMTSVEAAYWTQVGNRIYLRWVLPEPEDKTLDALARLHAAGDSSLGPDTRLLGSFRALGCLTPVWEMFAEQSAEAMEEPIAAFTDRLGHALAEQTPLTGEERGARAGLANRQITIR